MILLLIEWELLSQPWLYLCVFFETHCQEYYDHLLAVSQQGAWEAWLSFFLQGVSEQAEDAIGRIKQLQHLRAAYQNQVQEERTVERLLQVIDVVFERSILSIRQLEAALRVPYRTAQRYVKRLEKIGILREVTGRARGRIYQAAEVLAFLEDPQDGFDAR